MSWSYIETPIGRLLAARDVEGIRVIHFEKHGRPAEPRDGWTRDDTAFADLREQLEEYFAGRRRTFELPLAPHGTPFQQSVWRALQTIPFGRTWTYSEVAAAIGRPSAVRAVGAANGANPLPIVVPCHRVIGANGSLTGFGGGIQVKQFLLMLESR